MYFRPAHSRLIVPPTPLLTLALPAIAACSFGCRGNGPGPIGRVASALHVRAAPKTARVGVGRSITHAAKAIDDDEDSLAGRGIQWHSPDTATVAVTPAKGRVTSTASGTGRLVAATAGHTSKRMVHVSPPPSDSTADTLIAVGDIASCNTNGDKATAAVVAGLHGTLAVLGDEAYESGSASDYAQCYAPTWGRFKARTRPAPGNHDYHSKGASGYYDYFGALAGKPGGGYYSYELGTWHVVVLNSNIDVSAGSPQERWLRADLAAHRSACTLAYWHHPLFSSGPHGDNTKMTQVWQDLSDDQADVVLTAHDHDYERFAPQTSAGQPDPSRGIREFVVGTGGHSHYRLRARDPNSEAYANDTFGVLVLTLGAHGYRWTFEPVPGGTFTDSGSGTCHRP